MEASEKNPQVVVDKALGDALDSIDHSEEKMEEAEKALPKVDETKNVPKAQMAKEFKEALEKKLTLDEGLFTGGILDKALSNNELNVNVDASGAHVPFLGGVDNAKEGELKESVGVREYTEKLWDMINEDLVDVKALAKSLIYWLSEENVHEFMNANGLLWDEDEVEESLKEDIDFDTQENLKSDMYKAMAEVLYKYKDAGITANDIEVAVDWFLTNFKDVEEIDEGLLTGILGAVAGGALAHGAGAGLATTLGGAALGGLGGSILGDAVTQNESLEESCGEQIEEGCGKELKEAAEKLTSDEKDKMHIWRADKNDPKNLWDIIYTELTDYDEQGNRGRKVKTIPGQNRYSEDNVSPLDDDICVVAPDDEGLDLAYTVAEHFNLKVKAAGTIEDAPLEIKRRMGDKNRVFVVIEIPQTEMK